MHFATPGDPRSLVRSEPNTDWGSAELVFYQPRSTAAPLPSPAIQDFGKAYEELRAKKQQPHQQHSSKQHVTPSHIPSLGAQNNDYDFEGKSWTVKPAVHGNGGLTNAMRAVSAPIGTLDVTWIGSIGEFMRSTEGFPSNRENVHLPLHYHPFQDHQCRGLRLLSLLFHFSPSSLTHASIAGASDTVLTRNSQVFPPMRFPKPSKNRFVTNFSTIISLS